jgi:hypothetical protein
LPLRGQIDISNRWTPRDYSTAESGEEARVVWFLVMVALAGPADIDVGRAYGALAAGQPAAARDAAISALAADRTDPEAWAVYLDASAAVGLGALAARELAVNPEPLGTAPLEPQELRMLLLADEEREASATLRDLRQRVDDRPDFLLPLFDTGSPSRRLERDRERALRWVEVAVFDHSDDVAWLHRAVRVLGNGDGSAVEAVARLRALGEPAAPPRPPWSLVERERQAVALAEGAPMVGMYPGEARDVVARAADRLVTRGEGDAAFALWAQLRKSDRSPESALAHARLAVDQAPVDVAQAIAEEAVRAAAGPTLDDLGCNLRGVRAERLSAALDVRGAAAVRAHQLADALEDLGLAALLRGGEQNAKLADALSPFAGSLADAVRSRHSGRRGGPIGVAVQRAGEAIEAGEHAHALEFVDDALLLLGVQSGTSVVADQIAEALEIRARALTALGDAESALVAAAAADAVAPWDVASLAVLRAELHEGLGQREAAWVAWALAATLGSAPDGALERTYKGPAPDPTAIARAQIRSPPDDTSSDGAPATVAEVSPASTASPAAVSEPLVLGERLPEWSLDTRFGTVSRRSLRGRAVLMTVWSADCERCMQSIATLGDLARRLRGEGRDIAVVAVSVDDEETWAPLAPWAERFGSSGRDPELAARLGAWDLPVTWFVDPSGVLRYEVGLASGGQLERLATSLFDGSRAPSSTNDGR